MTARRYLIQEVAGSSPASSIRLTKPGLRCARLRPTRPDEADANWPTVEDVVCFEDATVALEAADDGSVQNRLFFPAHQIDQSFVLPVAHRALGRAGVSARPSTPAPSPRRSGRRSVPSPARPGLPAQS